MARGFNYAPGASVDVQAAFDPALTRERAVELGNSRNAIVRAAIAARADCPLGLMVTLAHDYSADVRAAVARNSHAQRTVMAYLATDRSVDVLTALLQNPSLPGEIVEELAFHKKSAVRGAAAARLDANDGVVLEAGEDVHTPELAEHVLPVDLRGTITADGTSAPLATVHPISGAAAGHTWDWAPDRADGHSQYPVVPAPAPTPAPVTDEAAPQAVPQIFAPHSTPGHAAPTRTAPVRGFKAPKE
jgi:hypothetical protein